MNNKGEDDHLKNPTRQVLQEPSRQKRDKPIMYSQIKPETGSAMQTMGQTNWNIFSKFTVVHRCWDAFCYYHFISRKSLKIQLILKTLLLFGQINDIFQNIKSTHLALQNSSSFCLMGDQTCV